MSSVAVKLDSWHPNGCPLIGFRIRYKLHGAKEWTQVNTDLSTNHQHNVAQFDQTTMDINVSNAQQLSANSISNSISLLGNNGFYSMTKESQSSAGVLPSVVNINDLKPDRKYLIQISAINTVGSTDAEYNVNTYSMISNELMRSSNRLLQHGQQLAQLADYTYLLPVCLSFVIITILLLMVCVVVKRKNQVPTNAATSLLYGSIIGSHKEELQMANFATTLSNKQKQINCDGNNCDTMGHLLITANGTVCESVPKLSNQVDGNVLSNGGHTGLEPLYATVKRTPRQIRNRTDPHHIYSYPVQSMNGGNNLTTAMNTLNNLNTMNAINTMNNLNNHLNAINNGGCNGYNTYGSSCNSNSCNINSETGLQCAMNCNQTTMMDNSCNMLNQCLDDKLMNCSANSEQYSGMNGGSSCNTSMTSGQLMSNNLNSNNLICTEHDQMMELGGLCQMIR